MKSPISISLLAMSAVAISLGAPTAEAQLSAAALGAFAPGPAQVTFTGVPYNTEMNGATVGGVLFSYSLGDGGIFIGSGPSTTNSLEPEDLESGTFNTGILTLTLPSFTNLFGYGYALLGTGTILNGTTITAFNGAVNLGSLSFDAIPDPLFPGGFAGVQSTTAFNRLELTFNSTEASAFAIDNIRFDTVVPEPSSFVLVAIGFGGVMFAGRRRKLLKS